MSHRAAVTSARFGSRQARQLILAGNLQKVRLICGNTSCKEYRELKDVIDDKATD
jgi:hypothetical protein